tara:strand:+ start:688 stop:1155 length:468 start_codon:yes stop_codon:yes gene_type:complete
MFKKLIKLVWNILGAPYYIVKKTIEIVIIGLKKSGVVIARLIKGIIDVIKAIVDMIIGIIKAILKWLNKGVMLIINAFSWFFKQMFKFLKYTPTILKAIGKWLIKAIKESIAQIFTLLGFFIAWLTLTGSAKDIVGIAIIISTAIWLLTMSIREE